MGDRPFLQEARTILPERTRLTTRFVQLLVALTITVTLALLAGNALRYSATEPEPNIVINGSFEEPVLSGDPAPNNWDHFPDWAVDGWHSITLNTPIEIMRGDKGPAAAGVQYVELDSNGIATGIYQDLETIPDTVYRIEFQFAARPGTGPDDNRMYVYWGDSDGELAGPADPVQLDGGNNAGADAVWVPYWRSAVATSETTRLEFLYAGTVNSLGGLLDDVVVYAPTCESVGDGAWDAPETWQCSPGISGIPGPGNDVIIQSGHTIVMTQNQAVNNITIHGTLENRAENGVAKGFQLKVLGDWTESNTGKYEKDPNGVDEISFEGSKPQKIKGDKNEYSFNNLKIKKDNGSKLEVDDGKKLLLQKKLKIESGELKTKDAEFKDDVEIEQNGKLSGSPGTTQTFEGDKKIDGDFDHGGSKSEFKGDKNQKIWGDPTKQQLYHSILIKKQLQTQAEFQKMLLVKGKTEVEEGKLKVGDAKFEDDVEIKEAGRLEGSEGKTKEYHGDKNIKGEYFHNKSKDRFVGTKDKQELISLKEAIYHQLELEKMKQADGLEALAKLKIESQLRLITGTFWTNTVFEDVIIESGGKLVLGDDEDPTEVLGNWTNDGDFDPGIGTVIFNGTDPQSIGGQSTTTFNNLEIQNNTTLDQKIVVNGTLKLTGPLTLGEGGEIEKGEDFQVEVGSGGNLGIGCDPGNTKLTGSGWFDSPAGAFIADQNLTGKAHTSFPIHCGDEGSAPTGHFGFRFDAANLEFTSTSIDSMLVLDNEVTITGYGQVNEAGDFGFAAVAVIGSPGNSGEADRTKVVIWDRSDGSTVYDSDVNETGPIATGGGNITLHSGSSGTAGPGGPPNAGSPPGRGPGGDGPPGRR